MPSEPAAPGARLAPGSGAAARIVPILLYHSVSDEPSSWIAPYTVSPRAFERHMDEVAEVGGGTQTVSQFADTLRKDPAALPDPVVLVTFDDGFADFHHFGLPAMARREIASTLYVATDFIESASSPHGDRMLSYGALSELHAAGVEVGGHSRTHAQLDTVAGDRLEDEVRGCKEVLEDRLDAPVRSFAYPHGYSSPRVRRAVATAGYDSACAVVNALSSTHDDLFRLARLTIRSSTSAAEVAAWLRGAGARVAPSGESARTRAWRAYRRARVRLGARGAVDL